MSASVCGLLTEVDTLTDVLVYHAREAFGDIAKLSVEWRPLGYTAEPVPGKAFAEYEAFLELLQSAGAAVHTIPAEPTLSIDALYARDASVLTPQGAVLCRMGKAPRAGEPDVQAPAFASLGIPVVGRIEAPGRLEGGDVVWLRPDLVAVGEGYRTNAAGISQFEAFLPRDVVCVRVPLPHWRGPGDVFHLMSILSPVDPHLLVVHSRLLPVPFRSSLADAGYAFVEVDDDEFETMGTNVLALAPGRVLMLEGNPKTRRALERAGADVLVYVGEEISVKGGGGPTCLTRPIRRTGFVTPE